MSEEAAKFASDGYAVVRGLLEQPARSFLHKYALTSADAGQFPGKDPEIPDTPVCYGDPFMEALLELLVPRIERHSGRSVLPTYSYFRIYKRGDVLARHTDRPACEISVTLSLGYEADRPWPIWIDVRGSAVRVDLEPGDALLYRGIDIPHWRDAFDGGHSLQVFLHYVDRDGSWAEWAFDKRAALRTSDASRHLMRRLMNAVDQG